MRNFFRKRHRAFFDDGSDEEAVGLPERDERAFAPEFAIAVPAPEVEAAPRLNGGVSATGLAVRDANRWREAAAPASGALQRSAADVLDSRHGGARRDDETELPRFKLPIPGGLGAAPHALPGVSADISRALREAFTPTRPKQQVNSLFVGRMNTLKRIISAIEEERAHVVLFGDRGRGKTSLANAIQQIAGQAGYLTLKLTCSAELSFEDIFRNVLRRVPSIYYHSSDDSPFSTRRTFANFDELLPDRPFTVTELNDVLASVRSTHVLLILDEYDRVNSEDLRNKLAELIKNLTDSSLSVTLFIVGVAESVDQLLGKHPSIQRSLVAVHLPLMSDREIERIVTAGAENAGISFDADVRERIVRLAKGLPYYAQLLSLHAARSAISRGSTQVNRGDLAYAVARCVQEAERSIVEAYHRALGPDRKSSFHEVLYAAAEARSDDYGTFHPSDMAAVPVKEGGEPLPLLALQYPLSKLADEERGAVLTRIVEPGGFRYRFRNQMMRQYVLMRQAKERGQL